jgi:hypothetical protein
VSSVLTMLWLTGPRLSREDASDKWADVIISSNLSLSHREDDIREHETRREYAYSTGRHSDCM